MQMTTVQPTYEPTLTFDFRQAIEENRLKGIWKMMVDFRAPYIGATAALAISALAKTFTYMLLRFFVDDVLAQGKNIGNSLTQTFIWIAVGFVGLAVDRRRICISFWTFSRFHCRGNHAPPARLPL